MADAIAVWYIHLHSVDAMADMWTDSQFTISHMLIEYRSIYQLSFNWHLTNTYQLTYQPKLNWYPTDTVENDT